MLLLQEVPQAGSFFGLLATHFGPQFSYEIVRSLELQRLQQILVLSNFNL
jgi:hypothetical protein